MKKIFQVGAGLVGKTMALDLSKNHELHLGDTNLDLLNEIKNEDQSIHIQKIDIQDKENFRTWIADADIVLLAVPGFLGFEALRLIIDCGKNVVDISFSPEDVLSLNDLAIENDVDVLWIGARSTVSPFIVQEIADALEGTDKIVLLKNPVNQEMLLTLHCLT